MPELEADGGPSVVESAADISDLLLWMFPEGFDLDVGDMPHAAIADAATSTDRIDGRSVASSSIRDVATETEVRPVVAVGVGGAS